MAIFLRNLNNDVIGKNGSDQFRFVSRQFLGDPLSKLLTITMAKFFESRADANTGHSVKFHRSGQEVPDENQFECSASKSFTVSAASFTS